MSPAIPILFFGDLKAYSLSKIRIVTVGLNPSLSEFPACSPFQRFPFAKYVTATDPDCYLDALSAYFRTDPYNRWFSSFEPMLNGIGASYYNGRPSTALHTDICSPIATDPTWNNLDDEAREKLEKCGGPLWHDLLEVLRPQVVVLSVAKRHQSSIEFDATGNWKTIHEFDRTADGGFRKRPVPVAARWYTINRERSLFVFVRPAQTPLGFLGNNQKQQLGAIVLRELRCAQ